VGDAGRRLSGRGSDYYPGVSGPDRQRQSIAREAKRVADLGGGSGRHSHGPLSLVFAGLSQQPENPG